MAVVGLHLHLDLGVATVVIAVVATVAAVVVGVVEVLVGLCSSFATKVLHYSEYYFGYLSLLDFGNGPIVVVFEATAIRS